MLSRDVRLVVRHHDHLRGVGEGDRVLAHPVRAKTPLPCDLEQPLHSPLAALLGLRADCEPSALEIDQLGPVTLTHGGGDKVGHGARAVRAEQRLEDLDQRGLAVLPVAVEEEENLASDLAREQVAGEPLYVLHQRLALEEDLADELLEAWTRCARVVDDLRPSGQVIFSARLAHRAIT